MMQHYRDFDLIFCFKALKHFQNRPPHEKKNMQLLLYVLEMVILLALIHKTLPAVS